MTPLLRILRWIRITVLLVLPLIVLWLFLPVPGAIFHPVTLADIGTEIPASTPEWTDTTAYGSCNEAMIGTASDQPSAIDKARAGRIGAGVIASQTDLISTAGKDIYPIGPKLVERQFPDGQTRAAWLYGEGRLTREDAMSGVVYFVYIDATTGAPLMIVKNVYAGDPTFTCPYIVQPEMDVELVDTSGVKLAAALSVAYVLVVALAAFVLWRRRARRNQAAQAL